MNIKIIMLSQTKHQPKDIFLYRFTSFCKMSYNINFFVCKLLQLISCENSKHDIGEYDMPFTKVA